MSNQIYERRIIIGNIKSHLKFSIAYLFLLEIINGPDTYIRLELIFLFVCFEGCYLPRRQNCALNESPSIYTQLTIDFCRSSTINLMLLLTAYMSQKILCPCNSSVSPVAMMHNVLFLEKHSVREFRACCVYTANQLNHDILIGNLDEGYKLPHFCATTIFGGYT